MHYILYNPLAGNGATGERTKALAERYSDTVLVDMTKVESFAELLSKISDEDVFIIAGGDGTLNRFINETEELKLPKDVFYYATGTGNDFLRDIDALGKDEPISIKKYIENLPTVTVNGKTHKFLNGVGYGIDGYCCEEGDRLRALSDKPVDYTSIAIKGLLFHYHPTKATVTVDGVAHTYKKVWIAPTMNGRFYGGGMMPTPEQNRLSDSHEVSVMIWHGSGKLRTLMNFPKIFKGEHTSKKKMIEIYSAHDVKVEFDRPTALQIDGETVLGVKEYSVSAVSTVTV